MAESFVKKIMVVFVICLLIAFGMETHRDNVKKEALETYYSEGGDIYVDGVKQEESFELIGMDLRNCSVIYNKEEKKLYIKR